MRAKDISGQAPGGKRRMLADALPLATPFVVQIFPIYSCNFKCGYCIFSVDRSQRHFISDVAQMDVGLLKKCIDEMTGFPDKVKVLRFVGIGEPLLHKHIAEMISYAVAKEVASTVELLTNGSLLTPAMSDALLEAGLHRLVVSLQGTSRDKYQDISGVPLDFDRFIANLRYFYEHKPPTTQMYLKVVDCALDDEADQRRFFEIFGDICDTIAIEHAVPIHPGVKFEDILQERSRETTQFGLPVADVQICPQPFFTMQINPDGKVVPCFSFEYPGTMGDCNDESVLAIWTGRRFQEFRRQMLDGLGHASEVCTNCNIIKYRLFPEDVLNHDAERLKRVFEVDGGPAT